MNLPWHQYILAFIFIAAGINHFRSPKIYIKIIPPYIPNPTLVNKISGWLEILFGIMLLFPSLAPIASVGIIILLLGFFATHFYMLKEKNASFGLPKWILVLRLPLQFILIYWASLYS
jgi:uncharacterized membrane protein